VNPVGGIAIHEVTDPLCPRRQGAGPDVARKAAAERRHGFPFLPALVPGGSYVGARWHHAPSIPPRGVVFNGPPDMKGPCSAPRRAHRPSVRKPGRRGGSYAPLVSSATASGSLHVAASREPWALRALSATSPVRASPRGSARTPDAVRRRRRISAFPMNPFDGFSGKRVISPAGQEPKTESRRQAAGGSEGGHG
jgi:hypothetical protein